LSYLEEKKYDLDNRGD